MSNDYTLTTDHLGKLIWETIHNDVYESDLSEAGAYNLVSKIMASEWYATIVAAAEQRGAERALREAAREYESTHEISIKHDEVIDFLDTLADEYRADQEDDDE